MTRVWISGAGGFFGHHLLEHVLATTHWHVTATDGFKHRGKTDRIENVLVRGDQVWNGQLTDNSWRQRITVVTHDLSVPFSEQAAIRCGDVDYMVAMASGSHVPTSIADPVGFVSNNVAVALNTLELARRLKPKALLLVSTDEVYGPAAPGQVHQEWSTVLPSSPYAASKAAQEAIAIAYWRSYGVPVIIVNLSNMVGERQDTEKYLPMLVKRISAGEVVKVHGRPGNMGSRNYVHVRNAADALLYIMQKLPATLCEVDSRPDRYNVAGQERITNMEMAQFVATILGRRLLFDLVDFGDARPGHDQHYGVELSRLTELGWQPPVDLRSGLAEAIRWTRLHPEWMAD